MLVGLSQVNIELSSRCDRRTLCAFCGHQDLKTNSALQYGDMNFDLLVLIALQIPAPTIISFHRDGDPLVYERLHDALKLFKSYPTSIVTHGEALNRRAEDIIDNCTTVTVSVIPNDKDRDLQIDSIAGFLAKKGARRPQVQLKFVGRIECPERYEALGVPIINRALHSKRGNWNYAKIDPPIPEIRVCLDFLSRPTVDWKGNFYICNRLNPNNEGLLGDLNTHSIDELWNGTERMRMLKAHLDGRRDLANPLCAGCEFYGIPTPSG